jgi:ferredoxin
MVKDEDVCLHCGLCAERCPTGAWDMQKFLLNMTHGRTACRPAAGRLPHERQRPLMKPHIEASTTSSSSSPTSTARARPRPTSCSPSSILRMGVPVSPRNIFPSNIQGLPTWYEVRVTEQGWLGRRGGVDLMVAMNPQTWDKDVAEIEPGGYLFYDSHQAAAAVEVPPDITRHRRAADRDLQRAPTPTRASASCSRTSSMSARCGAARHRHRGHRSCSASSTRARTS